MLRAFLPYSLIIASSLLTACGPTESDCIVPDMVDGALSGSIDDADWDVTGVSYLWSGSSLMVNAPSTSGYWMSAVLQKDSDNVAIDESITVDRALQVTLDSTGTSGWVTIYPPSGNSYTTKAGGGTMSVTLNSDDTLTGCFSVDAASKDNTINATAQFIALPSGL